MEAPLRMVPGGIFHRHQRTDGIEGRMDPRIGQLHLDHGCAAVQLQDQVVCSGLPQYDAA
eukprot:766769-Hanusia_phi.AAC.2